jgi:hypothetical protein
MLSRVCAAQSVFDLVVASADGLFDECPSAMSIPRALVRSTSESGHAQLAARRSESIMRTTTSRDGTTIAYDREGDVRTGDNHV